MPQYRLVNALYPWGIVSGQIKDALILEMIYTGLNFELMKNELDLIAHLANSQHSEIHRQRVLDAKMCRKETESTPIF